MIQEYQCNKKDKRLLVLFALGIFILFLNLKPFQKIEKSNKNFTWLELREKSNKIVRVTSSEKLSAKELDQFFLTVDGIPVSVNQERGKISTLIQSPQGYLSVGHVSPRLNFLLGQPFSVNIAAGEDLQLINGVGPSMAEKIITFREFHGPVKNSSQLQNINGIGPKTARKLTRYLTFTTERESDR